MLVVKRKFSEVNILIDRRNVSCKVFAKNDRIGRDFSQIQTEL